MSNFLIYTYDLKGIEPIKKQSFTHSLYGTGGRKSFLKELKGYKLGRNTILVPKNKEKETDSFFNTWKIKPIKIEINISKKELEKLK